MQPIKNRKKISTQNTPRRAKVSCITGSPVGGVLSGSKYKYVKIWRKNNPEKDKEHKRNYGIKHRKELNEKLKIWQKNNRAKTNKYFIEWGNKNPEKLEAKNLRRKSRTLGVKITHEEYKTLLSRQKKLCAICKNGETAKHKSGSICILSIDHNHKTKKVRGLLCKKCNTAIGMLNDDPKLVLKAFHYLSKNR